MVRPSSSNTEPIEIDGPESEVQDTSAEMKRNHDGVPVSIVYHVGQHIDVLDSVNRWAEAVVLKVDRENTRVYISYLFWSDKWNEWIEDINGRTALLHTHTYVEGGVLRLDQRIEVLDELNNWLESFVIEEAPAQVKIHYKGFASKFDEWIIRGSPRIRPFGSGRVGKSVVAKTWAVPGRSSDGISQDIDRTRKIVPSSDNYHRYSEALMHQELRVFPVSGDGNCLFRSVAHQVYGDDSLHAIVREKCMDYMEAKSSFFAMFVEGGLDSFSTYINMKRQLCCWGDDPEIQALCEIYGRRAHIWAFDPTRGARNLRTFHEQHISTTRADGSVILIPPINLSYYGGGHYDSLVGPSFGVGLLRRPPGTLEDEAIARAIRNARSIAAHRGGDVDSAIEMAVSDVEATDLAALNAAIAASKSDLEAFGDEDVETCLALSLSTSLRESDPRLSFRSSAKPEAGDKPGSATSGFKAELKAESKHGVDSASHSAEPKIAAGDHGLEVDDKALLDFALKQSADEHKIDSGSKDDSLIEHEVIEAQILEQMRSDSLRDANAAVSVIDRREPLNFDAMRAEQAQVALAIEQSEQEQLQQALLLSQQTSGITGLSDDELMQLVLLQSVMPQVAVASSVPSRSFAQSNASQNQPSGTRTISADDGDDEDLERAIAASLNQQW